MAGRAPPAGPEMTTSEYFDNMRSLLKEDCDRFGRRTDCHNYVQFIQTVDKQYGEAAQRYERLCTDKKHGPSCYELGQMHLTGQGMPRNAATAFVYLNQACDLETPEGCNNAGMLSRAGADGVPKNGAKALEYFHRACDTECYPNSCFMLNVMYLSGQAGVKRNPEKAFHYAEKACSYGHAWACVNASRMSSIGDGISQSDEKAAFFRKKAEELTKEG